MSFKNEETFSTNLNKLTFQKINPLLHKQKEVLKNYVAHNETLKELDPEILYQLQTDAS